MGHQPYGRPDPRPPVPVRPAPPRRGDRRHARRRPLERQHQPARAAGLGDRESRAHPRRPPRSLREHEGRLGDVPDHRRRAQEARGRPGAGDAPRCRGRGEEAGRRRRLHARSAGRHAPVLRADDDLVRPDAPAAHAGRGADDQDGRQAREAPVMTRALTPSLAAVWLVHGLYNKLLGGSPRHLAIVQAVPGLGGASGARVLVAVGIAEVAIAAWMISRRAPILCALVQTLLLLSMNVVELTFARPLLLWPAGLLPVNVAFLTVVWAVALTSNSAATPAPKKTGTVPVSVRTRLRRHPVPIRATLRECVTLTYAVPARVLQPLLPPGLELDTLGDDGFVAVALVQTERLRPDGVPAALGGTFFLAGYRVFARFRTADGRTLRGLRILRSDTDRALMALGGNLLTHYNYHRCHATVVTTGDHLRFTIHTRDGAGDLDVVVDRRQADLPAGSPFASVREARRFAGPLPFTFDYEDETHAIVAIEARRTNWRPAPVAVQVGRLAFFDQPAFAGCAPRLAAAFYVRGVDYHWLRGV